MVQKEVAQRLAAGPEAGKQYGPLSVIIGATHRVETLFTLGPGCFWPRPKVDSAVVRLTRRDTPLTDDLPALAAVTHRLFAQRRKQIGTTLGRDVPLPDGIAATMRPEQLTIDQLVALGAFHIAAGLPGVRPGVRSCRWRRPRASPGLYQWIVHPALATVLPCVS